MASISTVPDDEYTTEIHQVKIVVPSIVKKGGKFSIMHHGKRHILHCPPNVGGNDRHVFDVEVVLKIEDLPVAHNVVHVSHSTKTQDHLVDPDSLANSISLVTSSNAFQPYVWLVKIIFKKNFTSTNKNIFITKNNQKIGIFVKKFDFFLYNNFFSVWNTGENLV